MPDRASRRFPGAGAAAGSGAVGGAGWLPSWDTGNFSGAGADARTSGSAAGALADCSRSRSSGVFDHRQCKSLWKLLAVKPPVRTSAHAPQASRMVATMDTRRTPSGRRLVATAHTTKAGPRKVMAKRGYSIPMAPVEMDTSTMRLAANSATIIRTRAPKRSDQGARLKNNHHRMIAKPPRGPASTPIKRASGTKAGTTNRSSKHRIAMTTPGHSRSGLRGVRVAVCAMFISGYTIIPGNWFLFSWGLAGGSACPTSGGRSFGTLDVSPAERGNQRCVAASLDGWPSG